MVRNQWRRARSLPISGPMALPSFVGVDEVRLRAAAARPFSLPPPALFPTARPNANATASRAAQNEARLQQVRVAAAGLRPRAR